ncbi:major facilitator superfamily domain-containing protein 6-like [Gastrophryne carolinensis]
MVMTMRPLVAMEEELFHDSDSSGDRLGGFDSGPGSSSDEDGWLPDDTEKLLSCTLYPQRRWARTFGGGAMGAPKQWDISRAVVTGSFFFLLLNAGNFCVFPFLSVLLRHLGLSAPLVGVIMGARHLISALWAPFCTFMAKTKRRRRVVITSSLLLSAAAALILTALPPPPDLVYRFCNATNGLVTPSDVDFELFAPDGNGAFTAPETPPPSYYDIAVNTNGGAPSAQGTLTPRTSSADATSASLAPTTSALAPPPQMKSSNQRSDTYETSPNWSTKLGEPSTAPVAPPMSALAPPPQMKSSSQGVDSTHSEASPNWSTKLGEPSTAPVAPPTYDLAPPPQMKSSNQRSDTSETSPKWSTKLDERPSSGEPTPGTSADHMTLAPLTSTLAPPPQMKSSNQRSDTSETSPKWSPKLDERPSSGEPTPRTSSSDGRASVAPPTSPLAPPPQIKSFSQGIDSTHTKTFPNWSSELGERLFVASAIGPSARLPPAPSSRHVPNRRALGRSPPRAAYFLDVDVKVFVVVLVVVLLWEFFASPLRWTADDSLYEYLDFVDATERHERVRMWRYAGACLGSVLVVVLMERLQCFLLPPHIPKIFLHFYLYAAFMAAALLLSALYPVHASKNAERAGKTVKALGLMGSDGRVVLLAVTLFLMGAVRSSAHNFLFWQIQDLGGSELFMGLVVGVAIVSEMLLYLFRNRLMRSLSFKWLVVLALLCEGAQLLYYSFLWAPWAALPIQPLSAFSHGLLLWAAQSQVDDVATPGTERAIQLLLHCMSQHCGASLGSFAGGFVVGSFGLPLLYWACCVTLLVWLLMFLLIQPKLPHVKKINYSRLLAPDNSDMSDSEDEQERDWLVKAMKDDGKAW